MSQERNHNPTVLRKSTNHEHVSNQNPNLGLRIMLVEVDSAYLVKLQHLFSTQYNVICVEAREEQAFLSALFAACCCPLSASFPY